jgi:hypothetical protein
MANIHTTTTGHGSGMSNEEEAMQALMSMLMKVEAKHPVVLCGGRAFAMWLEILCGTSLVQNGVSSDGRGKDEFKLKATLCGRVAFKLSNETINTRSGMAWQVEERIVSLIRNSILGADDVAIYDGSSVAKGSKA